MGLAVWKREGYVDDEGGPPGPMKEALQMFQRCLFPLWAIYLSFLPTEVGIDASSRQ